MLYYHISQVSSGVVMRGLDRASIKGEAFSKGWIAGSRRFAPARQ
jgi:hypothetical protein